MNGSVVLENHHWSIILRPEQGGSIVSCEYMGFPIFEPARPDFEGQKDVFAASCFPLIPYSNRIGGSQFSFGKKTYRLAPNHPQQEFPIHGNAWEQSWDILNVTPTSCEMTLTYHPRPGGWPWSYQARQVIRLNGSDLVIELTLKNISKEPFPAGVGIHPFFSNARSAHIQFNTDLFWMCDDKIVPTSPMPITPETDFTDMRPVVPCRLDNCFMGWDGKAVIHWPEFNRVIEMEADSSLPNLVVYIQPENSFFCLEPVSHINNALNLGPSGDMNIVNPGGYLQASTKFSGL